MWDKKSLLLNGSRSGVGGGLLDADVEVSPKANWKDSPLDIPSHTPMRVFFT